MTTVAIDFESYYDKECSIRTLGPMGYFTHPKFDAYMVTVAWEDDRPTWVGNPRDFNWALIKGATVVSHNASFDETLYLVGVDHGWWWKAEYAEWHCTADMAAYLGMPRALSQCLKHAYNIDMSKQTRNNMSGKQWDSMTPEFQKEVSEYAKADADFCLKLWVDHRDKWPIHERRVSAVNRKSCQRGIPVDVDAIRENITKLKKQLWKMEEAIPWKDTAKLLSRPAFNEECRKHGLEPPKSLAKDDPETQDWVRRHASKYLWIEATTNWRRVNALVKKLEAFENSTMSDGRYYGNIMYFGAHTGRFSGSGGNLNLQNLPQGELFGVNLRSLIKAPKGKKLVQVDLSQIEVRTTCWAAQDWEMLEEIKHSPDVYETFAVRFGLWDASKGRLAEMDSQLRSKPVKPMVLGCGFGAGAAKLALMFGMDEDEAQDAVNIYRSTMKPVVDQWKKYDTGLVTAHSQFRSYEVPLPSGRSLKYEKIKRMSEKYKVKWKEKVILRDDEAVIAGITYKKGDTVVVEREEERVKMATLVQRIKNSQKTWAHVWGGVVMENVAQGLARDVFVDRWLALEEEGYDDHVILSVHDELLMEVDEDKADQALADAERILSTSPSWIPELPLAAEGKILDVYTK